MAHNINRNINTGKDAFFSVKEKAWHGLGQIVDNHPTAAEAIKFAGLDFEVVKKPLYTPDLNFEIGASSEMQEIKTHFATMRTDTQQILGVVGKKYTIVQNADAFTFFDSIAETGVNYETAGALGDGERVFITAKLPNTIKVADNDHLEQYIFLTTSHDGSGSIQAAFTPIRIVCNNTLTAALKNCSNMVTIRHTASATEQLSQAWRVMGICQTMGKELQPIFQRMAKTRITDEQTKKLIQLAMAPNDVIFKAIEQGKPVEFSTQFENILSNVWEYSQTSETQLMGSTAGTVFGAYNAITGYFQNVKDYRSDDAKLTSILFGSGADRSQKAFDLCQNAAYYLS
jgi:phage/plasmid-like protein (TIGR03299 family)